MIFQIGLIAALCILAIYAYFQWRKAPLVAGMLLLVTLAGLVFAVAPDIANDLAHRVGIGRGADLIMYFFILISLMDIFNVHLRFRASEERFTQVVRALALLDAGRK